MKGLLQAIIDSDYEYVTAFLHDYGSPRTKAVYEYHSFKDTAPMLVLMEQTRHDDGYFWPELMNKIMLSGYAEFKEGVDELAKYLSNNATSPNAKCIARCHMLTKEFGGVKLIKLLHEHW